MKIENNALNQISTLKAEEARNANSNQRVATSSSIDSRDKAQVSGQARLLAKARTAFDSASEIREETVASIRQQLTDGSYAINYSGLAQKLTMKGNDRTS
jgi:negative regulator of flagellin synthesis FlgM